MQVAQQFLAALARDWDSTLGALTDHLDRGAPGPPGSARSQGSQTPAREPGSTG